jgi:hypothetical protein
MTRNPGESNLVPLKTRSQPLYAMSESGYAKAVSLLDTQTPVSITTALLPSEVCREVVSRIDGERNCDIAGANDLVSLLLRCYPDFKAHDPKGYVVAMVQVFASYPASAGRKACDPVTGVPGRLKFVPKPAELKEALDAEMKRRDLIKANALSHMQEREERQRQAKAEAELIANRGTQEERAERVRKLLKVRPMPMEGA